MTLSCQQTGPPATSAHAADHSFNTAALDEVAQAARKPASIAPPNERGAVAQAGVFGGEDRPAGILVEAFSQLEAGDGGDGIGVRAHGACQVK